MFSVPASPYNSLPQQLYGGWTTGVTSDTATAAAAGWDKSGSKYFQDTKWASMAEKYAVDPETRDLAAHIRAISKNVLKEARAAAKTGDPAALGWIADYNNAAKNTRTKLRLPPLSYASKQAIWNKFAALPWKPDFNDETKAWFALASRAPYISAPEVPGLLPADVNPFVSSSAKYALPDRMSMDTRKLLALARGSQAVETVKAAQAAYDAAIANGATLQGALAIARSILPTFTIRARTVGNLGS